MRLIAIAAAYMLCLTSCQKLVNYYNIEGTKKSTPCRVSKLTFNNDPLDPGFVSYRYNADKNPESLSTTEYGAEQSWETFEYDEQKRLTNHYRTYYFTEITNYVYEGNSRLPVRDTLYDFADRKYVEHLTYDDNGRIVKVDKNFVAKADWYLYELYGDPLFEERTSMYFYDIRGNQHGSPLDGTYYPLKYSDVPSFYSLNFVWQLVNRDFSKHRLEEDKGATFNAYGLPLTFEKSATLIEYECD